jgi:hypothetical protein
MKSKLDQIRLKQKRTYVENYVRINNLAFIHFNYHLNIMILSKYISVQNQNPRIKFHQKLVIDANTLLIIY